MALEDVKDILSLFATVETRRKNFESQWQEIADYVLGRRDFTVKDITEGRKRTHIIYDNTGNFAGDMLAAALHNFLTNAATRWFGIEPQDSKLMADRDVRLWFEAVEEITRTQMNHASARFVPQMHENWIDLAFFCTSAMMVESVYQEGSPIRFSARPLTEIFVAEDPAGRIDTVFRKFQLTNRQAQIEYGDDLPSRIRERVQSQPEGRSDYLQAIHKRDDPAIGKQDARGMPWRSVHIALDGRERIREGGYWEMPLLIARWEKDAGEVYGRGPGIHALADCKMANMQMKTVIKAAQKIADPPLQVADDGVLNPLDTSPGSVNVVRASAFSQDVIKTLDINPNIPITLEMIEATRQAIRSHFKFDLLSLLRPQPSPITATQTLEIVEGAQTLIAPQLARLQVELLEPMIERVFGILARRNFYPPAPQHIQGMPLKIRYISPVERAQRMAEVRSLTQTLAIVGQMAQLSPDILDNLDLDAAARIAVEAGDTNPKILRDARAVKKMRDERAAVLAQQQAQQEQMALLEQAPNIAQAKQVAESA